MFIDYQNMKLRLYPVIIFSLPIILIMGLMLANLRLTISLEKNPPEPLPPAAIVGLPNISELNHYPGKNIPQPLPTVKPPTNISVSKSTPTATRQLNSHSNAQHQGVLRISNLSDHPVRLALLAWQAEKKSYSQPAHWDFAPEEGGSNGLLLSLPEGSLKLQSADVLVAFAQDGSRRYWGPYIVGKTDLPIWNSKTTEWHLVLKP